MANEAFYFTSDDKCWEDVCRRVAGIMPAPLWEETVDALERKLFLPGTPILRNANAPGSLNQLSCHNIQVQNSIRQIWEAAKHTAMLLKSGGGGVGLEFSKLAPRGKPLRFIGESHKMEAHASGPVSFLELFIMTGKLIGTARSGKPSGMMCLLNAKHPDAIGWIMAKDEDGDYDLCNMSCSLDEGPDSVDGDVWQAIVRQAWKNGTPGVVFLDRINEDNAMLEDDDYGPIETVNVCQPGFATVLTPDGIRTFDSIEIGSTIWGKDSWVTVVKKWDTGLKDVYRVTSSRGEFVGTLNHKVFQGGERVTVVDAKSIDQPFVDVAQATGLDYQAVLDGLIIGDGSKHKASNDKVHLYIGANDGDYFSSPVAEFIGPANGISAPYTYDVTTTIQPEELPYTYLRVIPDRFFYGDVITKISFLRGLFSANGGVVASAKRIGLRQSSARLIKQVQLMLSSLGVESYVTISRERKIQFANGEYLVRESYDLNITTDAPAFMQLIGFEQQYKVDSFVARVGSNRKVGGKVQKREHLGKFPVYEITVDDPDHAYWTGGLLASNCAENPAYSYEGCALSSIVLPNVIEKLGDWGNLLRIARLQTLLLNRVVDQNHYPLQEFRESAHDLRRIGGGALGFATLLKREGIPLYSEEANSLGEEIASLIYEAADEASWWLADRDGGYRPGRRRNVSLMAIAPNGHGAILAECTPSIYCDLYNPVEYRKHLEATPKQHVDHIAAWQGVVDGGVSYTVSIPSDSGASRVEEIYRRAYDGGLKAISVYRDQSRDRQPCKTDGSCGL